MNFLFWGCVGRRTLCCVSNDLKFCLECDRFFSDCEMLCHMNRVLAGGGVALNRNVRTDVISDMEVGVADGH